VSVTKQQLAALQLISDRGSFPFHELPLRARGPKWRMLKRMRDAGLVDDWPPKLTPMGRWTIERAEGRG
jgi:hypothetical protein